MHPKFTRMRNKTIEGSEKSKKNERYVQKIYDTKMTDLPICYRLLLLGANCSTNGLLEWWGSEGMNMGME